MNRFILNLHHAAPSGDQSNLQTGCSFHADQYIDSQQSVLTSIIGNIGEDLGYDSDKDTQVPHEPQGEIELTALGEISVSLTLGGRDGRLTA